MNKRHSDYHALHRHSRHLCHSRGTRARHSQSKSRDVILAIHRPSSCLLWPGTMISAEEGVRGGEGGGGIREGVGEVEIGGSKGCRG